MENKTPDDANYDRAITSAETAARMEREGEDFKQASNPGQTVDKEGLANNYAVEPEMYYEEPGDRKEILEAEKEQRAKEIEEVNTPGGKGPGVI
ncbi:hypothetical protein [Pleurocapsa sp. PCC 7319]|uniref:hypothetical protein n=1 Tax=Pleurocapsa sp. PCC 7319 TaxID=118161 RepID=UPI000346811B|nr:hypothetical protein [Pleurocapsa sp. PCC 7319]